MLKCGNNSRCVHYSPSSMVMKHLYIFIKRRIIISINGFMRGYHPFNTYNNGTLTPHTQIIHHQTHVSSKPSHHIMFIRSIYKSTYTFRHTHTHTRLNPQKQNYHFNIAICCRLECVYRVSGPQRKSYTHKI